MNEYSAQTKAALVTVWLLTEGPLSVATVAAQVKRAGCRAGFPDLILLCARGGWHGLAIELKTAKGHTSPMQDVWLDNLRKEGYFVAVCRGAVEAVHAIERYLEMA